MKKTNAIRQLDDAGISYQIQPYTYHPDQLDVAHIAAENGLELGQIFKTLVCKGDKTGVVVAVVPGDRQLDLKLLAAVSGNKKMTMAPIGQLQALTGYIRGGCAPIGMKKPHPVWIDQVAMQYDLIYVNAGKRGVLIGVSPQDLLRVTEGRTGIIVS